MHLLTLEKKREIACNRGSKNSAQLKKNSKLSITSAHAFWILKDCRTHFMFVEEASKIVKLPVSTNNLIKYYKEILNIKTPGAWWSAWSASGKGNDMPNNVSHGSVSRRKELGDFHTADSPPQSKRRDTHLCSVAERFSDSWFEAFQTFQTGCNRNLGTVSYWNERYFRLSNEKSQDQRRN